jgi:hypothetical protein
MLICGMLVPIGSGPGSPVSPSSLAACGRHPDPLIGVIPAKPHPELVDNRRADHPVIGNRQRIVDLRRHLRPHQRRGRRGARTVIVERNIGNPPVLVSKPGVDLIIRRDLLVQPDIALVALDGNVANDAR